MSFSLDPLPISSYNSIASVQILKIQLSQGALQCPIFYFVVTWPILTLMYTS